MIEHTDTDPILEKTHRAAVIGTRDPLGGAGGVRPSDDLRHWCADGPVPGVPAGRVTGPQGSLSRRVRRGDTARPRSGMPRGRRSREGLNMHKIPDFDDGV